MSVNAKEVSKALSSGDFATVLSLIEGLNREDLDQLTACLPDQRSPLHYACQHGRVDIAHKLITKFHYSIKSRDEKGSPGCTPLHIAAEYGQLDTVKYLTQTLLTGDLSLIMKLKLSAGLKLLFKQQLSSLQRDLNGNTPWHTACVHGKLDIVEFFTNELGCDSRDTNNDGMNCLHLASINGDLVLVKYLVEVTKCDLQCTSKSGQTPVDYARLKNNTLVEDYLEAYYSDTLENIKLAQLHLAACSGHLTGGAPQGGQGGRPPPQLEHWGGIAPPTLGYNTKGCLRVHYCLYSVTVYTG